MTPRIYLEVFIIVFVVAFIYFSGFSERSIKTNIAYLNTNVNLSEIFWKIIINDYCNPETEVVKKQMKFNSLSKEELAIVEENYNKENYKDTFIITHIDNPGGRIKFKDIRKLSIGLSKKDILSYRCKQKSAFYKFKHSQYNKVKKSYYRK
jgi:hypothetical protein